MSEKDFNLLDSTSPKIDSIKIDFPNLSSITESIRDLTNGFAEMHRSIVDNPAIKELSETLASIHKFYVCDVAKEFQKIKFDIVKPIKSFVENESVKSLFRGVKYLSSI